MDCESLWPTTTKTTQEPGCYRGASNKVRLSACSTIMAQPVCCICDSAKTNERWNKMKGRGVVDMESCTL